MVDVSPQKLLGLTVVILIFVSLLPLVADNVTDLSDTSKTKTNESLGTGISTYSIDEPSVAGSMTSIVISNGSSNRLTNSTHYTVWLTNQTVVIKPASGATGNIIYMTYTYTPTGSSNLDSSERTLVGLVTLLLIVAMIVKIRREYS